MNFRKRDFTSQLYPDSKVHGANMGPTLGPCQSQIGPMLASWTLLSGYIWTNRHARSGFSDTKHLKALKHCGLVMPHGVIKLSQHWFLIKAYCLTAPGHYLNQYGHLIIEVLHGVHVWATSQRVPKLLILYKEFENHDFKITATSLRVNELTLAEPVPYIYRSWSSSSPFIDI